MLVAPYAGAWIEILFIALQIRTDVVAPYAGAWIEIFIYCLYISTLVSHPTRVRGLKSGSLRCCRNCLDVAPYAGAWIEMPSSDIVLTFASRTLRGCVD